MTRRVIELLMRHRPARRRGAAVALLALGGDPESVAERTGLELEQVCELAELVAIEGRYA